MIYSPCTWCPNATRNRICRNFCKYYKAYRAAIAKARVQRGVTKYIHDSYVARAKQVKSRRHR